MHVKTPYLPEINAEYNELLKRNSEEVAKWPLWKREIFSRCDPLSAKLNASEEQIATTQLVMEITKNNNKNIVKVFSCECQVWTSESTDISSIFEIAKELQSFVTTQLKKKPHATNCKAKQNV